MSRILALFAVGGLLWSTTAQAAGYKADYRQLKHKVGATIRALEHHGRALSNRDAARLEHLKAARHHFRASAAKTTAASSLAVATAALAVGVAWKAGGPPWGNGLLATGLGLAGFGGTGSFMLARDVSRAKGIYSADRAGLKLTDALREGARAAADEAANRKAPATAQQGRGIARRQAEVDELRKIARRFSRTF